MPVYILSGMELNDESNQLMWTDGGVHSLFQTARDSGPWILIGRCSARDSIVLCSNGPSNDLKRLTLEVRMEQNETIVRTGGRNGKSLIQSVNSKNLETVRRLQSRGNCIINEGHCKMSSVKLLVLALSFRYTRKLE